MAIKDVITCIFTIILFTQVSDSQDITIGTLYHDDEAFDGFTLFAPVNSFSTFLIDNCGESYKQWDSENRLGTAVYLLEDGSLLRTARTPGSFSGGGIGGKIEQYSWDGELVWEFTLANDNYHMHHDIEVLPNGNILAIAWEYKTEMEAILNGKNSPFGQDGLWPDIVIEIQRGGPMDGEIIWTWRVWDHLIQNTSPQLENYGFPDEHPGRIDINFLSTESDWNHINGIDYNPNLDQIALSCKHFSEIWIIDHSTTNSESAGSEGGLYGKGGDILYRWGNPMAYNRGTNLDQIFFGQHDIRWIDLGLDGEGKLTVFNNGIDRSSVSIIDPDINADGSYNLDLNEAYLPVDPEWTYDGGDEFEFFSRTLSGAQALPNGNILVSDGTTGNLFEIDLEGNPHWFYEIPVNSSIMTQGDVPTQNQFFKAQKYSRQFQGFEGKDLVSTGPIEFNPIDNGCMLISNTYTELLKEDFDIYQDIINGIYKIETSNEIQTAFISNQLGKLVKTIEPTNFNTIEFELTNLDSGCYYTTLHLNGQSVTFPIIKI